MRGIERPRLIEKTETEGTGNGPGHRNNPRQLKGRENLETEEGHRTSKESFPGNAHLKPEPKVCDGNGRWGGCLAKIQKKAGNALRQEKERDPQNRGKNKLWGD